MRIGELARRSAVSPRSLRYYESRELLLSTRSSGGHRVYADDSVERVQLIQLLLAAGLGTAQIVHLLPCIYSGTTTPAMVRLLEEERDRLDAEARRLAETRDRLAGIVEQARGRLAA